MGGAGTWMGTAASLGSGSDRVLARLYRKVRPEEWEATRSSAPHCVSSPGEQGRMLRRIARRTGCPESATFGLKDNLYSVARLCWDTHVASCAAERERAALRRRDALCMLACVLLCTLLGCGARELIA